MQLRICRLLAMRALVAGCGLAGAQIAHLTNHSSNTILITAMAADMKSGTANIGSGPMDFGVFAQQAKPAARFAGTPGAANCYEQSVSALVRQYGNLDRAAASLNFSTVTALQGAILSFCGG